MPIRCGPGIPKQYVNICLDYSLRFFRARVRARAEQLVRAIQARALENLQSKTPQKYIATLIGEPLI